jgi:hypothetical protein
MPLIATHTSTPTIQIASFYRPSQFYVSTVIGYGLEYQESNIKGRYFWRVRNKKLQKTAHSLHHVYQHVCLQLTTQQALYRFS